MYDPKILLMFFLVLIGFSASAQITFEKRYDYDFAEAAHDIQQTSDGGYVLAGRQGIWIGFSKILLIKTDSLGNEEWHRLLGENNEQYAYAVHETEEGGFILSGYTITDTTAIDMYLVKTNAIGEIQWTKTFGGVENDTSFDLQPTPDGGYIQVGNSRSFGSGDLDIYVVKTDSVGNLEWERNHGGEGDDIGFSIKNVVEGGYIIAGYCFTSNLGYQACLLRTDAQGDTLWTKTFGWEKAEFGQDVIETPDGGFLLAGITSNINPINNYDKLLVKMDSQGDTLWTKIIADNDTNGEGIYAIKNTPDGNFVTIGTDYRANNPVSGSSSIEIIKYDYEGNIIWQNEYGGSGSDVGYAGITTTDGGFAAVGLSDSDCGTCAYFIKTGPDGEVLTSIKPLVIEDFKVSIYPNPAFGQFTISFQIEEPGSLQIDLFDLQGRLIKPISKGRRFVQQYEEKVGVESIPSGLYIIRILSENGGVAIKKLIVD